MKGVTYNCSFHLVNMFLENSCKLESFIGRTIRINQKGFLGKIG